MIARLAILWCWLTVTLFAQSAPPVKEKADPVALFQQLAAQLPRVSTYATGEEFTISEPVVDVKRSDSLISPLSGTIDCTFTTPTENRLPMRLEFSWTGTEWKFSRLVNRRNRRDFTDLPGGREMLENGPLKLFLAPYRRSGR